jgi:hypothetical protein
LSSENASPQIASLRPSGQPPFTEPVIDYEPPPEPLGRRHRATIGVRPCPPPSAATLHRSTNRRPRTTGHVNPAVPVADTPAPRPAAVFADAVLRRVLEVIDRRRPVAQLRPLMAAGLVDMVVSMTRPPASTEAAAVLRRVRVRAAGEGGPEPTAGEVFATYTRGPRVRAIAGRVELRLVTGRHRWQLVALQIG